MCAACAREKAAAEAAIAARLNDASSAAAEPDPAEVGELAAILHQQTGCGCAGGITDSDRKAARAALLWMKDRRP